MKKYQKLSSSLGVTANRISEELEYVQTDMYLNSLIRKVGLYPYMDIDSADWQDAFVYNLFKADVGLNEDKALHREQYRLLSSLLEGKNIAVSAPTSFGKSFVIDAFIKIKKPQNVAIIVPTIALTDETRRRLYKKFAKDYNIITTTDVQLGEKNIFIFVLYLSAKMRAFNWKTGFCSV